MIERTGYLNKIKPFIDKNIIKIIVGIRRCGKSTLMIQIMNELKKKGIKPEQIVQINFEDYEFRLLKQKDELYSYLLNHLCSKKRTYIFLDEIQEVIGFEEVINSLNTTKDVDIYLTGSNSRMLAGEYATLLTGRYVSFELYPFSFQEMKAYYPNQLNDTLFLEYVKHGGLPQIQMFDNDQEKKQLLMDLYNSVVIKDLVQRYGIRDVDILDRYLSYFMNTISSLFSAKNVSDFFKSEGRTISRDTLYNYLKYAEEAYFVHRAKRYDIKGKKILSTNEKIFINDQGFRSIQFNNEADIEKVLENIVFYELLRRGYEVYVGYIDDKEIDFIATKGDKKCYYQVAYVLDSEKTIEREFGSLLKVDDAYPKYVISTDKFNRSRDGIEHRNIIDFLLERALIF